MARPRVLFAFSSSTAPLQDGHGGAGVAAGAARAGKFERAGAFKLAACGCKAPLGGGVTARQRGARKELWEVARRLERLPDLPARPEPAGSAPRPSPSALSLGERATACGSSCAHSPSGEPASSRKFVVPCASSCNSIVRSTRWCCSSSCGGTTGVKLSLSLAAKPPVCPNRLPRPSDCWRYVRGQLRKRRPGRHRSLGPPRRPAQPLR